MKWKWKLWGSIICVCCILFSGCAMRTKVSDAEITLHTSYGDREGTYTGELRKGVPDGEGVFVTKNETGETWTYEGAFKEGHISGQGRTKWNNGQYEEGNFENDLLNGEGKVVMSNKIIYEGTFKDGKLNGETKVLKPSGDQVYQGNFEGFYPTDFKDNGYTSKPFEDYARNPENSIGEILKVVGMVTQSVPDDDGTIILRLTTRPEGFGDSVLVVYRPEEGQERILENDIITVFGLYQGLAEYTSLLGAQTQAPQFIGYEVKRKID